VNSSCLLSRLLGLLLLALVLALPGVASAAQDDAESDLSAEEQLAQEYAPIAYLKRQDFPCDPGGEPYPPAPVEIVFGDPAVALRELPGRREVKRGPAAADLYDATPTAGADAYLDLPGDPRQPGCDYERHANGRMRDLGAAPVVYAHVAAEEVDGEPGLALQYWFWYYFNDFNDKHESDWEMIQLRFDAATAEAALGQEPVEVAFSQHKGGETAPWAGDKLRKEDGRPVTFPSRGSHGNYYAPGIWLGWGEDGSGLGCDNTTGPSVRVEPEVRYVPDAIAGAGDPFAWAAFGGHWGERESWVYDGPKGPNLNARWEKPISWQAGLRDSSLKLQEADAIGPSPTGVFCAATRTASDFYAQAQLRPWVAGGVGAALAILAGWLVRLAWPVLAAAWRVWTRHLGVFLRIGAVLIPVGLVANALHYLVVTNPPTSTLLAITERAPVVSAVVGLALANLSHLAMLVLVGPAVVQATADARAGREPSARRAFAAVRDRFRPIAGAALRLALVVGGLALTVVGLPWALRWAVRWGFFAQAAVVDGAVDGRAALAGSARAVRGHWWGTLAIGSVLVFVAAALGPLLGIPILILFDAPLDLVNGLAGFVYAVTHPLAVVGGTLLYERLAGRSIAAPVPPAAQGAIEPAPA